MRGKLLKFNSHKTHTDWKLLTHR